MTRCHYCKRFVHDGQVWCRDCEPERPCRDFPPTCAPYKGVCCMEEPAEEPSRCPRCEGYEATYHTFEGECSAAKEPQP